MSSSTEIYVDKMQDATNGERGENISTDIESAGRLDPLVAKPNYLVMSTKGRLLYLMLFILYQVFQTAMQNATKPIMCSILLPQRATIKRTS